MTVTLTTRPSEHPVFAGFSGTVKTHVDRAAGFADPVEIAILVETLDDALALLGRHEHAVTGDTRNADRATRILIALAKTLKETVK